MMRLKRASGHHHDHAKDNPTDDHHHGEYNMHIWLSPAIAKQAAIAIHDRLLELTPQNKDKLDANLRRFEYQLAQNEKILLLCLSLSKVRDILFS